MVNSYAGGTILTQEEIYSRRRQYYIYAGGNIIILCTRQDIYTSVNIFIQKEIYLRIFTCEVIITCMFSQEAIYIYAGSDTFTQEAIYLLRWQYFYTGGNILLQEAM